MTAMKRCLAAGALVGVGLFFSVPAQAAQTKTRVLILNHDQSVGQSWYGNLESERTKCVDERKVRVFRKLSNGSKVRIGSTRSTAPSPTVGVWSIPDNSPKNSGRYFATVGAIKGCAADRSAPFDYPEDQQP